MPTQKRTTTKKAKKKANIRDAEAGVKSAHDAFRKILEKADRPKQN